MQAFAAPLIVALALLLVATVLYYRTKTSKMHASHQAAIEEVKGVWFHAGFDSGVKHEHDAAMIRKIVEDYKNGK